VLRSFVVLKFILFSVCRYKLKIGLFQLLSAVYTCIHPRMVVSERWWTSGFRCTTSFGQTRLSLQLAWNLFFKLQSKRRLAPILSTNSPKCSLTQFCFFLFGVWSIAISSRDPMKDEHPSRWPYGFVGKTLEEPRDFFAARSEIQRTADASKSRCGIWGERRCGDGPLSSGFHHWRATNLKTPPGIWTAKPSFPVIFP